MNSDHPISINCREKLEFSPSLSLLSSLTNSQNNGLPLSQILFCSHLMLKLDMWPTSRHASATRSSSFMLRNNLFHLVEVQVILNELYLIYFPILRFFSKIPFFFHQAPDAPKIMKIRLSRNLTKFVLVTRFCETNPTVRFVSLPEIYKNFSFVTCTLAAIYCFTIFQKNSIFPGFNILPPLKIILSQNSHTHTLPITCICNSHQITKNIPSSLNKKG